jgi:hypothetical protein
MSDELVIYHTDSLTGEFIGSGYADPDPLEPGNWLIPARAYREQPPEPDANQAVIRTNNEWELVADYRGFIYSIENGSAIQHDELGEVPYGFTTQPCPGPDYLWIDSKWMLDQAAQARREQTAERAWRDSEVDSIEWLRDRHRDEDDLGTSHVLTADKFTQLLTYMQALRDWPQAVGFPSMEHRPLAPSWIADEAT